MSNVNATVARRLNAAAESVLLGQRSLVECPELDALLRKLSDSQLVRCIEKLVGLEEYSALERMLSFEDARRERGGN